jgi:hypothetical protein
LQNRANSCKDPSNSNLPPGIAGNKIRLGIRNAMNSKVLGLLAAAALTSVAHGDVVLTAWNYEAATISGTAATFGPIAASTGVGSASGVHASASSVWSSPAGNGSSKAFSSDHWAINDYYQFQTSTILYSGVTLSWDQTRSSSGPASFNLQYSTDGSAFTTFSSYTVGTTAWSSGSPVLTSSFSADLSSITALNNQPSVYFRLVATSAPTGTAGTTRNDNFSIVASVPEPAVVLTNCVLGLVVATGIVIARRQRKFAIA